MLSRLGYDRDTSRSEKVRWLVARCEPLLLVGVGANYLLRLPGWRASVPLVVAAVAACAFGLVFVVRRTDARLGLVRGAAAAALLIALCLVLRSHRADLVLWFSILGISYPLLLGWRRVWPLVAVNAVAAAPRTNPSRASARRTTETNPNAHSATAATTSGTDARQPGTRSR